MLFICIIYYLLACGNSDLSYFCIKHISWPSLHCMDKKLINICVFQPSSWFNGFILIQLNSRLFRSQTLNKLRSPDIFSRLCDRNHSLILNAVKGKAFFCSIWFRVKSIIAFHLFGNFHSVLRVMIRIFIITQFSSLK